VGVVDGNLLKIGQVVAKQVALAWLAEKKAASRRGRDLTKLVRARFPLRRAERDVLDSLVRIEDDVADQLAPGLAGATHGLPSHEREAAYAAASDALINRFPRLRKLHLIGACGGLAILRDSAIRDLGFGDCSADMEPLRDMPGLRSLYVSSTCQGINLAPLADQQIEMVLGGGAVVAGVEKLGPGVTLRRLRG
jgi:hypothetical protein